MSLSKTFYPLLSTGSTQEDRKLSDMTEINRGSYMSAQSCLIKLIKRVEEKRYNLRLAEHFIFFSQQV